MSFHSTPFCLPSRIETGIRAATEQIQMRSATALEALKVIKDPDCDVDEFVALAEHDLKLATDILRMANSGIFMGSTSVRNLSQAVVRLGLERCKNLTMACVIMAMSEELSLEDEWIADVIRTHGIITGTISSALNEHYKMGFDGEEFAIGLMHDVGRLLLAFACGKEYLKIDPMTFNNEMEQIRLEREHFHTGHDECGAWFAHANNFPESLVETVRYHHSPEKMSERNLATCLLALSDDLANHFQRTNSFSEFTPSYLSRIVLEKPFCPFTLEHLVAAIEEMETEITEEVYSWTIDRPRHSNRK
ncbi:MAG: HDOD domain-containing protein [Pirellulaceae bacterium]